MRACHRFHPGRDLDHPYLAPILERLPNDMSFMEEAGGVTVSLTDNGEEISYSALELVAMVLSSAQVPTRIHLASLSGAGLGDSQHVRCWRRFTHEDVL